MFRQSVRVRTLHAMEATGSVGFNASQNRCEMQVPGHLYTNWFNRILTMY